MTTENPTLLMATEFLLRHEPWLAHARRDLLPAFLDWYWRDGRIGIVREGQKILAVALGRCLSDPKQANDPYHHDEAGRIVWIEHIASVHALGVPLLLQQAMQRFGPREAFAGHVFKRAGELRMLPWKIVERLAMTPENHGLTFHPRATCAA